MFRTVPKSWRVFILSPPVKSRSTPRVNIRCYGNGGDRLAKSFSSVGRIGSRDRRIGTEGSAILLDFEQENAQLLTPPLLSRHSPSSIVTLHLPVFAPSHQDGTVDRQITIDMGRLLLDIFRRPFMVGLFSTLRFCSLAENKPTEEETLWSESSRQRSGGSTA
jgi:hypothetical protein